MKKMIFLCIALLFVAVLPAVAESLLSNPPPFDFTLAIDVTSILGVATLTLVLTGWIKTFMKIEGKFARWVSWIMAMAVSFTCWLFNLGLFEPLTWYITLIYGFGIGLVANGIFTSETVQAWLQLIGAQPKAISRY